MVVWHPMRYFINRTLISDFYTDFCTIFPENHSSTINKQCFVQRSTVSRQLTLADTYIYTYIHYFSEIGPQPHDNSKSFESQLRDIAIVMEWKRTQYRLLRPALQYPKMAPRWPLSIGLSKTKLHHDQQFKKI